jgi:NAD(P)H dehydrogenase (quinone)
MSANIAVIYAGAEIREVAAVVASAAEDLSARVRLLRAGEDGSDGPSSGDPEAALADLEWADGIGFGTPLGSDAPAPALMRFLEQAAPLWQSDKLVDKVVTIFTDEPEHFAPGPVVHPIVHELYEWGAVIVGPRGSQLALDARPQTRDSSEEGPLSGPRMRTARYRGRRLTTLAEVVVADRARRTRLEI